MFMVFESLKGLNKCNKYGISMRYFWPCCIQGHLGGDLVHMCQYLAVTVNSLMFARDLFGEFRAHL